MFGGEVILFHESSRMVHRLNALGGAVWLLCDGETPVGSFVDELAALFGDTPGDLAGGVDTALAQLAGEGLLAGVRGPDRVHAEPVDRLASDGSRILPAPPDL